MSVKHFVIPDTQVKPGIPLDNLDWFGKYIVETKPDVVVMLGDWYDLPSLSSWDRGKAAFQGRRFKADVAAGHAALDRMWKPINDYNATRRQRKERQWEPEKHVVWGNHEDRADRCAEDTPELKGFVGTFLFDEYWQERGWKTHAYKEVIDLDGIWYSHLFTHELTDRAMGAIASTLLKQIGHTFTQGHRQTYDISTRYVGKHMHRALIAGASYLHDEDFKGPSRAVSERSGNHHWRGCIMKHDVSEGEYSLMELPLDFFCRRYTGMSLDDYMEANYPDGLVEAGA